MAYVNVLEWKAEQVADWLRGLDDVVYPYAHFFLNNDVTGQGLLNLTVDDLYKLHVEKLGHQEIILESLELLRNFHYNLDQENLQYICLRLSCKARSLYNEMSMDFPKVGEKQVVRAPVMSSVADVLDSVRLLLSWLERKPFDLTHAYHTVRTTLISLSLELATNAQRDTFAEQPMDVIRSCCDKLAHLADKVIQEFTDPLILQPASLDVATVRKRAEEELGIILESGQHGIHLVVETRMLNPTARVVPGDEIVQVNYQTVVGWQTKKVVQLMGENPIELILTLKKRPRHSNLGQIYMKPFRIPARKKSAYYINNLPSPRTELLVVPDVSLPIVKRRNPSESSSDLPLSETETDSEDDEAFLPVAASEVAGQIQRNSNASPTQSLRSVLSRPRSAPQRRATISGTSPSHFRPYINVSEIWAGLRDTSVDFPSSTLSSKDSGVSTMSNKNRDAYDIETPELREKSTALQPRPVTVTASFPCVTSAPNLLAPSLLSQPSPPNETHISRTPKPRMPDPPSELHVNRIHVSSPQAVSNSVYMNVPSHLPEYVNVPMEEELDKRHQYVNVPLESFSSPSRQPLPKPRTAKSSLTEGVHDTHHSDTTAQTGAGQKTTGRGKRPVPLPRRLSSISSSSSSQSSPRISTSSTVSGASPCNSPTTPTPPTPTRLSAHISSPNTYFSKAKETPSKGAAPQLQSPRRKTTSVEVPTPTANFRSYRRVQAGDSVQRRASCVEESPSGDRRVNPGPSPRHQAPPPPNVTKSKSMTKLSFDQQKPIMSRADSGVGLPSMTSAESLRLSSVSSADSGYSMPSPVRVTVTTPTRVVLPPRADFIRRPAAGSPGQEPEKRNNKRQSGNFRFSGEESKF
jgi:hypothetical protein